MPRKRKARRKQHGEGPVWDWIKKNAGKAHDFVKSNKLISRGASALAPLVPAAYSGTVSNIGNVASKLGYGKRQRKRGRPKKK